MMIRPFVIVLNFSAWKYRDGPFGSVPLFSQQSAKYRDGPFGSVPLFSQQSEPETKYRDGPFGSVPLFSQGNIGTVLSGLSPCFPNSRNQKQGDGNKRTVPVPHPCPIDYSITKRISSKYFPCFIRLFLRTREPFLNPLLCYGNR